MRIFVALSLVVFSLNACSKASKMEAKPQSNSAAAEASPDADSPSSTETGEDTLDPIPGDEAPTDTEAPKPGPLELRAQRETVYWPHRVANAMTTFYNRDAKLWLNSDSWENPHAFIALIDFMDFSGNLYHSFLLEDEGLGVFPNHTNLASDSYQNTAWWALALIRTYDLTKEYKYLNQAKALGDYLMTNAWDDKTCSGGMWKDKAHSYLDASSSEVYIKVMAALHNRIPSDTVYIAQATKAWNWFEKGPFNENGLIANYIQAVSAGKCNPEPSKSYYSHNQGVILGAAAEMFKATLDRSYLEKGLAFAKKSMAILSKDGIFNDFNEASCNNCTGVGNTFKGIYVRYLRELAEVAQSEELYSFLDKTAEKAWNTARSPKDLIGAHWGAAFDSGDLQRQTAALDLFNSQIVRADPTNIALNAPIADSSPQCVAHHFPKDVNDGSAIAKWCVGVGTPAPFLTIDLGSDKDFSQIKMINCGGGTEPLDWNTRDFTFSVASNKDGPYTEVAAVKNNYASFWNQKVKGKGRYLKLTINHGGDGTARINEIIVEK